MNKKDLCIATMSLVRSDDEEHSMREALLELSTFGIPIFITDGGSNEGFCQFLQSLPNVETITPTAKGLAAQVCSSLQAALASGTTMILYTEPDKLSFFRDGMQDFIERARIAENTGVVIAARSEKGFHSYPAFQQMTETMINKCTAEITGAGIDYTYGPFLLNRKLVPYIHRVPADIGWGWRTFTFGMAHRLRLTLEGITGDYLCPPDHGDDTPALHIYRMKQMCQSVEGVVLSTNIKVD